MTTRKEQKAAIRPWLKQFTHDRLAALLAHAQDGKLEFYGCCCLAGAINANHALRSDFGDDNDVIHLSEAKRIPGAKEAESAFNFIGYYPPPNDSDKDRSATRRRVLIPMILAEFRYRERASKPQVVAVEVTA